MVILRTLFFASFATACYSPDVRDCTVTCNQAADCAPGQVCGEDGFCAAADVAGRCASIGAPNDAGVDAKKPSDAMPDAPPDAMLVVRVWVRIDGRGVVSVPAYGECDAGNGQAQCPFDVTKDVPLTLHATPKNNWRFGHWQEACDGQPTPTCVISPAANTLVRVRFENDDDDDDLL